MRTRSLVRDDVLGSEFAEFARGRLREPYGFTRNLRETDPVHWSDALEGWLLTKYDDVLSGLMDPRFANDRISAYMAALHPKSRTRFVPLGDHVSGWLGFTDPPKHTRLRGAVKPHMTPAGAATLRPFISEVVDSLTAEWRGGQSVEVVADLAFPLPATVVCRLLGIPEPDRARLKILADAIVPFTAGIGPSLNDVAEAGLAAVYELESFFRELVAQRIDDPRDDLLTPLAHGQARGDMSDREITSLCVFLFVAGFATTTSLIANAVELLLSPGVDRDALRADETLRLTAIEEVLRYESPIQQLVRVCGSDVNLRGQTIAAGETVILMLAAANRDPVRFPDPDRFMMDRSPNRHLAFGWSTHFCLGAPLARLETLLAVTAVLERFPGSQLAETSREWMPSMSLRSPENLWLELRT